MDKENYTVPAATFTEKPEGYELKVLVPGIGKGDADLSIEGRTLTLKTHAEHSAPTGFKQVASEFSRANYALSADLPEMADTAQLSANLENGVLTVFAKKRPANQAKQVEIL